MNSAINMTEFSFFPSADQAARFDTAMQTALRESVLNLAGQAKSVLQSDTYDRVADWAAVRPKLTPTTPAGFGAYYDCVAALMQDEFQRADQALREIVSASATAPRPQIKRLGTDYSPSVVRRFQNCFRSNKTDASGFADCSSRDAERFSVALNRAQDILAKNCPDLFQEFETLIREIVLVAPDGTNDDEFEGGTSFKLWGALFLNAESEASPVELAITLAHEEGHAVLFGMCQDEMLVENMDDERYWSAIRQAERPLEGIFHATFVSARMAYTARAIEADRTLSIGERRQVRDALDQALAIYLDGVPTLTKHARFTKTGKTVFQSMTEAMNASAATV